MSKTKWTDERIKEMSIGIVSRNLMTQIRNDMQTEIDALRLKNETLQHQLDELAKLAIQQPTNPQTEADYYRKRCRRLIEENNRLHLTRKTLDAALAQINSLRQQLIDILDVAIARGEKLEYSDDDWREWYKELVGEDWQVAGGTWDNQEEQGE